MSLTVEKCLQAWTNSLRQINAKADVVFFGDSLTYYGNFASAFPDKVVCNLGLRGDTIQGMIDRVEQVQILEPKRVFLMAGINDVASISASEFKKLYAHLVDAIIGVLPNTELLIQSKLPVNSSLFNIKCNTFQIEECNTIIKQIAESRNQKFLNIFAYFVKNGQLPESETQDGIHLKLSAYFKWYEIIKSY
jgi:lysophospholipase L1-like esterase